MNKNDPFKREGKLRRLIESQLGRCAYCGDELRFMKKAERKLVPEEIGRKQKPTLDHIMPKRFGGSDEESNLVAVHYWCNQIKRDLRPEEIIKLLENMRITFESRQHYPLLIKQIN